MIPVLAFVLIVIAAMVILIFKDWRVNSVALGVQYLAAFALVMLSWPIGLAVVKLIAGWMATAAIATTCMRQKKIESAPEPAASLFFRGMAGLLIIVVVFIVAPSLQANVFPRVELMILQAGLLLMGMSLMQLGMNSEPYLVVISLLSFLSGFEVIHAALELSTLLTGLFVLVNLGLALVGVYLVALGGEGDKPPNEGEAA